MLINDQETPFDLKFRIGSIPVRVQPWFWLTAAFLGWPLVEAEGGMAYLLVWIGCCFFSILLHELGHVWMGMCFGSRGHIVLWGLGGLAIGSSDLRARWQRIAVYLAGPAIQLALWGVLYFSHIPLLRALPMKWNWGPAVLMVLLLEINLVWPLLNLLPIFPLDGGRISRELFEAASPRKGVEGSLMLSIGVAGVLALHCFLEGRGKPLFPFLDGLGGTFMALWFAIFCILNIQMLQAHRNPWGDDRPPWER